MALGGNTKLQEFFQIYDLNDESVQQRYGTRGADFYRLQLRTMCENIPLSDQKPTYESGREQMPVSEGKSAEEIMENNPPYQSADANAGGNQDSYLDTGLSYFNYAKAKASENVAYVAEVAKAKADEQRV